MKKKYFLVAVFVLIISCLCSVACSKHVHTYAEAWRKDQDFHWHEPLCSDAQPQKQAHSFVGNECSICGYIKQLENNTSSGDSDEQKTPDNEQNSDEDKNTDLDKDTDEDKNIDEDGKTPSVPEERVSEAMIMYKEAVEAGYEGTYLKFLSEYKELISARIENSAVDCAMLSVVSISATFTNLYGEIPVGGAGVILSLDTETYDAYILTNYHIIYDVDNMGESKISQKIQVWLYGSENENEALSATFFGGVMDKDVAVLYIDGNDKVSESNGSQHTNKSILEKSAARAITVGNSNTLSVGDKVYVIGNPAGYGTSVTCGVVSVESEYMDMYSLDTPFEEQYKDMQGQSSTARKIHILETRVDAAINHGNSGGGLFNANGEYVGTVNARNEQNGIVAFGYAIPANMSVTIAKNIINNKEHKATHADFGFTVKSISSRSVYEDGAARIYETVTVATVSGSSENKLQVGDEFVSYKINDGKDIPIVHNYQLEIASYVLKIDDKFSMTVKRNGTTVIVTYESLTKENFKTVEK